MQTNWIMVLFVPTKGSALMSIMWMRTKIRRIEKMEKQSKEKRKRITKGISYQICEGIL